MKSMQSRLIFALTGASVTLVIVTGMLLYRWVRSDFVSDFDQSLHAQAGAITSLVEPHSDGRLEFEFNPAGMPEYQRKVNPDYFAVRFANGRKFASSKSFHGKEPPQIPSGGLAQDVMLPTGEMGRGVRIDFIPQSDPGDPVIALPPLPPGSLPMNVLVARDRHSLDAALATVLRAIIAAGALFTAIIALTVLVVVRQSFRPLRSMSDKVGAIDATHLDQRLDERGIPVELLPISTRLNDLLDRLQQAFVRERRFTSDIAHELRTPIAELRSIADVALRWPDDPVAATEALRESQQIAQEMQTLVTTLLALVRCERMPPCELEPISLGAALKLSVKEVGPSDVERIVLDLPLDVMILTEPTLLASILRNVISNAVEYSTSHSIVRCRAQICDDACILSVENQTDAIQPEDLPHLFAPFWRKDNARTSTSHSGLGLSLVRAYCAIISASVDAAVSGGRFALMLTFPLPLKDVAVPGPARGLSRVEDHEAHASLSVGQPRE